MKLQSILHLKKRIAKKGLAQHQHFVTGAISADIYHILFHNDIFGMAVLCVAIFYISICHNNVVRYIKYVQPNGVFFFRLYHRCLYMFAAAPTTMNSLTSPL